MCDYCASESSCTDPSCAATRSACACSLAGNGRCPTCGHECLEWSFGMSLPEGPDSIRAFFGEDENPGFQDYPATRAQILAAAQARQQELEEDEGQEAPPSGVPWLAQRLPEGTYRSEGEVFAALTPVITAPQGTGPKWVRKVSLHAIAAGTRLIVPPNQIAFLVHMDGYALDAFAPGEYVLSAQTAPLTAAISRRPAPGFPRWVLRGTPVFVSAGDLDGKVQAGGMSRSGTPVGFQVSVKYWLRDPQKFARSPIGQQLNNDVFTENMLSKTLSPPLAEMIRNLDGQEPDAIHSRAESVVRAALEEAGIGVRSLAVENPSVPFGMGPPGPGGTGAFQPDMLARMPPEVRAMMEARMKEAMQRHAAASAAGGPRPGTYPSVSPVAPGPATGGPRVCSSCRQAVAPGVKFCGKCGTRMG